MIGTPGSWRAGLRLSLTLWVLASFAGLEGQETPVEAWKSSIGAGLAVTSGNSDTRNINVSATTTYDPKKGRLFKASALYLRGDADGEKKVDKATANVRNERTLSERLFWFAQVSYLRDPFKAINYQVSPIAGAGWKAIETETRKLSFDGGLGSTFESNFGRGQRTSGAIEGGQSFDWVISETAKFAQRLSALAKIEDPEDALYHFEAGVNTTIATRTELKVSYTYDYKNKVTVPGVERGDSALVAALVFKF